MGASARLSSSQETVTEIHNDIEETVDSLTNGSSLNLGFSFYELLTPQLQNYLFGDGVAQLTTTRQKLKRWAHKLVWPSDDANGNPTEFVMPVPYGIPQSHDSTLFPPATSPSLSATGSGDFTATTWYAWGRSLPRR